ncbi:MAG: trigger factor [Muribaculaceae bacterium]|nr:trigger factor [Muribaculaceae bacterium]
MNVEFKKLDNVNGELTVTLEEKDYADKVKKQLKEIGKNRPEPGFRAGHVPMGILEKKYGTAVKYDVVNRDIVDAVYDYIRDNKLRVLGQPVPDKDNELKDGATEFTFKFKVGLAPEIDAHIGKDMKVPYYTITVTDDMVDQEITALRKRFGVQGPGEETEPDAVIKGVISELNSDGSVKEDGIVVDNGILAPIHFTNEEQKKLFEGKHPGDIVVFNPAASCNSNVTEMSSMLNIDKSDVENHKGDFNFEIKEIIVLKPAELDQEFFDNAVGKDKAHNEEELKAAVKELIKDQLKGESDFRFTIDSRNVIEKAVGNVQLPEEVLKKFLISQNQQLNDENIDEEFTKIRSQLVWDLTKDEIISKFKIEVSEEDIMNQARVAVYHQLSQYGPASLAEGIIEHYAKEVMKDQKNRDTFERNALNKKIYDTIKENVTLDNKELSIEEFKKLYETA